VNNGNANEKLLYHASNSKFSPCVKRVGLDPRPAKLTGSIGVGVYFSKSSTIRYVSEQDEIKQILYSRVSVGRSIKVRLITFFVNLSVKIWIKCGEFLITINLIQNI